MQETSSFRSKIQYVAIGLILLTSISLLSLFAWYNYQSMQQQARLALQTSESVLNEYLTSRNRLLTNSATVLTSDFGFKQAVATRDAETINSALLNHGGRINADLMILFDLSGNIITENSKFAVNQEEIVEQLSRMNFESNISQYLVLESNLFQVVLVPITAPTTIGFSMIGFHIDQDTVQSLKRITQTDIGFYNASDKLLTASFIEQNRENSISKSVVLPNSGNYRIRLFFDTSELEQQAFQALITILLISGAVIITAFYITKVFSKSITRPLARFINLAQQYAAGNFNVDVKLNNKTKEITELSDAFVAMGGEIAQREKKIEYQANYDLLTGLMNRNSLVTLLQDIINSNDGYYVININIKGFQRINNVFGIKYGDSCLKLIAMNLLEYAKQQYNNKAHAARINSDDFILVIPKSETLDTAITRLNGVLNQPFEIDNVRLAIRYYYSSCLIPDDGKTPAELLRRLQFSLDKAKTEQVSVRRYKTGEDEENLYHLKLVEDLERILSIETDQLYLCFHPKINLATKKADKAEVLMRWIHPDFGFIAPDLFIDLAERTGLIVKLTQWVISQSLLALDELNAKGIKIKIAINVSSQDLADQNFVDFLKQKSSELNIPTDHLIVEITERDIMENESLIVERLDKLKAIGIQVSIDDYGIGQSSLGRLKSLPIDELKIDKSFIMHISDNKDDQHIVSSTIDLAKKLSKRVVAEGVEDITAIALLEQYGCDYAQGYYYTKPLRLDEFSDWIVGYES